MANLDSADMKWMDTKFTEIHNRISETHARISNNADRTQRELAELSRVFFSSAAAPCKDTVRHIEDYHNPAKFWGLLASMVAVAAGVAGAMVWLLRLVK